MSIAAGQVLEGMPDPAHLHRIDIDDRVVIMVGSRVLFCFAAADTGMRNLAVVTLTGMRLAANWAGHDACEHVEITQSAPSPDWVDKNEHWTRIPCHA